MYGALGPMRTEGKIIPPKHTQFFICKALSLQQTSSSEKVMKLNLRVIIPCSLKEWAQGNIGEANLVSKGNIKRVGSREHIFPNCHKPREISIGNRTCDIGKQLQHSRESVTSVSNCRVFMHGDFTC